jgi:hypothetical protein
MDPSEKPKRNPPTVDAIKIVPTIGPIPTKSDALLTMLLQLPESFLKEFMSYDEDEISKLPSGRKGLRMYCVTGLKEGKVGGAEFHRNKREFFFMFKGKLRMDCEDAYGSKKSFELSPSQGLSLVPFVMHTYTVLEDGDFLVVANTLFDREDKRTYDTYPIDVFREMQQHYSTKRTA